MNQREFLNQVIDTVEAQAEAIDHLQKQASEAANKPAFSDDVLNKTAEKLVTSKLLSKEASENLIQSFREDPEQALLSLQKVAGLWTKERESAPQSLGKPRNINKSASANGDNKDDRSESDKAWERDFGNEAY
jgi:hypothetical protein